MLMRCLVVMLTMMGLAACQSVSSVGEIPNTNMTQAMSFQITELRGDEAIQNSLLIIEPPLNNEWRWVQVDALGAPIARKILKNGSWHTDGFLPPNAKANQLFSAVYAYLLQKNRWQEQQSWQEQVTIELMDEQDVQAAKLGFEQRQWLIRELPNE